MGNGGSGVASPRFTGGKLYKEYLRREGRQESIDEGHEGSGNADVVGVAVGSPSRMEKGSGHGSQRSHATRPATRERGRRPERLTNGDSDHWRGF